MADEFIPVNTPLLDGREKAYLAECIDSGWISSEGPFVQRLEEGMARRTGRKFGIAVCNGSAALDVAVAALGLKPGDEVILPSFTIISCATAILRAGAVPVVVDSDPLTWNMDVTDPLLALAARHGLRVIEDAAEAIGQNYRGRPCGGFGDVSTLSFYPNKHVTTGEGGMVLTDDPALAERCRSLRNLCFGKKRFVHEELGWNYRMSNLQAALGVAQLERLDEFIGRKRRMGERYAELLGVPADLQLPAPRTDYAENIYWVFGIVLGDALPWDAEEAMSRLHRLGIGTRPFFWPMHEQPALRRLGLFAGVRCPVAERLARRGFYLPSGLGLSDAQQERAASALTSLTRNAQ